MQSYYYLLLDVFSFLIPFLFSFEKRRMHFIQHWKAYFTAIINVGIFFILWDIYFAYEDVWGFNDQYLIGVRIFKLPLEEYLFFLLIPYASVFIHYALKYFFPNIILPKNITRAITYILFFIGLILSVYNYDKMYTFVCIGLFTVLMLLQLIFEWKYARRFYLSFIIIFIPFFFVNSALTGSYSENPVVFYDNSENLGIRLGTIPVEDAFYCFALLYSITLVFEYLKTKKSFRSSHEN
ncbi:lycopene cyclase domain-containing protein [Chryseobacterium sp. H3056]|uniref:Lycopene cyclase domain-containing protein n=1 Tax=Kaistella daneshvariae TaxID=2487074 RepID=A0A3N0WZY6_9FLAO|nr:lycopene cyclase domain-containing protein [Kaistella daneshvariae]ROI10694.1 lycopene cyclase domain-containing protein [Kaistella daneshvariae]